MSEYKRGTGGKFAAKGDEERKVRSLRLTDSTWKKLGAICEEVGDGATRADLIERWANDFAAGRGSEKNIQSATHKLAILEEALELRANAGGAIKAKIREFLTEVVSK